MDELRLCQPGARHGRGPGASRNRWRAVTSPFLHHVGYILIIATEIVTTALCAFGAIAMVRQLRAKAQPIQAAKSKAVAGLTLGFLLFEGGFVAVGGDGSACGRPEI